MTTSLGRRIDGPSRMLLVGAGLWSCLLIVGAATLPLYTSTSSGIVSSQPLSSQSTLVQQNGLKVLVPTGLPLVATVLIATILAKRARSGQLGAGVAMWVVVGVMGAASVVGILSIGIFLVPPTAMLIVVVVRCHRQGWQTN